VKPGVQDLKPRQVRALVLLLVLLPLCPMVMLFHSARETRRLAREAAWNQTADLYIRHLEALAPSTAHTIRTERGDPDRRSVQAQLQHTLGTATRVVVLPETEPPPEELGGGWPLLAAVRLAPPLQAWKAYLFLDPDKSPSVLAEPNPGDTSRGQILLCAVVLLVALTAGWALSRRLRLSEMRNSALAAVAHELKTPIASSRLLIETLERHGAANPALLPEYLPLLSGENHRLARIIEDFLLLARMEQRKYAFHFEETALDEVIAAALEALRVPLSRPGTRFTLDLPERLPRLRADPDALQTVLVNLLENAVKYSEGDPEIRLSIALRPRSLVLAVEDRGVGIPPESLSEIFKPFHQADNRLSRTREGCGLGLGIVRQIVRAHGGRVRAENRPGGGTRFTVILPVPAGSRTRPSRVSTEHLPAPAPDTSA